jgi:predicted PurR-regulated permease PerM
MNFRTLQTVFFLVLLVGSAIVTGLMFGRYLIPLAFGGILAVVAQPLYVRLRRLLRSEVAAALLVIIAMCLMIIIPLTVFVVFLYNEASMIVQSVGSQLGNGNMGELVTRHVPEAYRAYTKDFIVDTQSVVQSVAAYISRNLPGLFANVFEATLDFVMVMFSAYYLLKDGPKLRKAVIELSPLGSADDESVISKLLKAVSAVVNGVVVIAVLKAVLTSFFFWLFGVPQPVFWGAVGAFAAFLPVVGIGVVTAPAIVYLFLDGHVWNAVWLTVVSVGIIGTVDNFLQPLLVESQIKIHPLLVLLSVMGGLSFYGFSGFILGPLTLAVTLALLDIYRRLYVKDLVGQPEGGEAAMIEPESAATGGETKA